MSQEHVEIVVRARASSGRSLALFMAGLGVESAAAGAVTLTRTGTPPDGRLWNQTDNLHPP